LHFLNFLQTYSTDHKSVVKTLPFANLPPIRAITDEKQCFIILTAANLLLFLALFKP